MTNSRVLRAIEKVMVKGKRTVQQGIGLTGYQLVKASTCEGPYQRIHVGTRYAPWKEDRPFRETYERMQDHSLVDIHRCYELWSLVEQSSKLPEGALLEVGVWKGGTGALIARQAERCGIKDKTYLCDTFAGVVKTGPRDAGYADGEHDDTSLEIVEALLRRDLRLSNVEILQGVFPEETGRLVEGETFRFCHIDVDVYQSARDVLAWIWERVVVGGIVVYDDYGFERTVGITRHVEEVKGEDDRVLIYNLNGHGILIKTR